MAARLRVDLGYDGTEFSGWAIQPGRRTVAGVLGPALELLARSPVRLVVAGRTDAGVHAAGQVAHVDVAGPALIGRVEARRLNGLLPPDVRVRSVRPAPPGFDARFAALGRTYSYRVADGWLDPLRRRDTLAWPHPLDEGLLAQAGAGLLGLHDFAAFCRRRERATTIRTLERLDWSRDVAGVLTLTIKADAFCHSMVRSLVGALLPVGDGRQPPGWPAELFTRGRRAHEVTVAPAHGLTLVAVDYPADHELAERAEFTRARRAAADALPPQA